MAKPRLILDQHFRKVEELFAPDTLAALCDLCEVEDLQNAPMDREKLERLLPEAAFLVAARPDLTRSQIGRAHNLKAIIEVSGAFHGGLDYSACFERGIEVLSCAPGFRHAVAEMGLAMILAGARGLVAEHEHLRQGIEHWVEDCPGRDVTLFRQKIGFVGYGNIARELHRLLMPFDPRVSAYDPWLTSFPDSVTPCDLDALFRDNRIVVVTAVPSQSNREMVGSEQIAAMPEGGLLVLLSRAHVMDFTAAADAVRAGRITFATDVFPSEPLAADDPLRMLPNVILSPHRAAAVEGGRQPIGEMILHDVSAILSGKPDRNLLVADAERVEGLVKAQREIERAGALKNT